jgi:hypothetical protein
VDLKIRLNGLIEWTDSMDTLLPESDAQKKDGIYCVCKLASLWYFSVPQNRGCDKHRLKHTHFALLFTVFFTTAL